MREHKADLLDVRQVAEAPHAFEKFSRPRWPLVLRLVEVARHSERSRLGGPFGAQRRNVKHYKVGAGPRGEIGRWGDRRGAGRGPIVRQQQLA
jgi:hypothetical protein